MAVLAFIFLLAFVQAESASLLTSSPIFGPRQVTGLLGGSVTVKCFYPPTSVNRHSRKYWCKESTRQCSTIISSNGYVSREFKGRALITDFPENGIFTILISELRRGDMGMYKCGVSLNDNGLSFRVKLDVSVDSTVPDEAQLIYVEQHGSVTMHCDLGAQYASARKYLCKMSKNDCYTVIDSYGKIDPAYEGRVLLTFLGTPGSFSIFMTQLKKKDSGSYLCGAGIYGAGGESKELDIHVYEGTLVPKGQLVARGVQGGSVSIECHYDPKENYTRKQWCKLEKNRCLPLINDFGYVMDSYEGRIVMHDNPRNGTFTILLNQLNEKDAGFYWCVVDGKEERRSATELKIVEGKPNLVIDNEINAVVGAPLKLSCSYSCEYADYEKYWCKWKNTGCEPLVLSTQNENGLVVNCDATNRILSLNFDQVSRTDQGWYWCGVRRGGHYAETTAMHLEVQEVFQNPKEDSSADKEPSDIIPEVNPRSRGLPLNEAKEATGVESPVDSHEDSKNSSVLVSTLVPLGVVFLLLVAIGIVVKRKVFKHSDLVSVGSYRTNISMTDFENVRQYGAKDNVCMDDANETQLGTMDENITSGSPKETGKPKKTKRGSTEEIEMAYTTVLLNEGNKTPARRDQEQ
ncbi:polymeric immunoglobulin receptor [Podarcis muralis]